MEVTKRPHSLSLKYLDVGVYNLTISHNSYRVDSFVHQVLK